MDPKNGTVAAGDLRDLTQSVGMRLPSELFNEASNKARVPGTTSPRLQWRNFYAAMDYTKLREMEASLRQRAAQDKEAMLEWRRLIRVMREQVACMTKARRAPVRDG